MTADELGDAIGTPVTPMADLAYDTLSDARQRVLAAMRDAHTSVDPQEGIVAFGEAANNALKHSGGGRYGILRRSGALQVFVSDSGGGIDFKTLPRAALTAGFSTTQTLGMGFTIMLDLTDRLLLATRPGRTDLVLEFAERA